MRKSSTLAVVSVVSLLVTLVPAMIGPAAAQPATTEACATIDQRFVNRAGGLDTVTVPIGPVVGVVETVTVVVDDRSHPDGGTQASERVTIIVGDVVIGTTPDLPDDEVGATYLLAGGVTVEADAVTVTHAHGSGLDSITVRSVCVQFAPPPPSTTTTTSTTTTSTTSTTTSTSTTTTVAPSDTPPPSTTAVPVETPGQGSFAAACAAEGTGDLASLVWTAQGTLPSEIVVGQPVVLTDQIWSVSIPGSVIENARGLGLVAAGDAIPVTIGGTIAAAGTEEGTQSATGLGSSVAVAVGAEGSAFPAVATAAAPDMTFTPNADRVDVRLSTATVDLDLGLAEPVSLTCTFDDDKPPFVSSPPTEVLGPPPGELAITGPGTYLWAAIIIFVLLDVGYLMWSVGRPERSPLS